ncbi:hypothetical protein Cgig2_007730 [Carnegiea gigantea]|uniref:Uncharacterized protein n=1 Tax=Carnegiea gigantea TaxID=171969 RepID=A0A9Q1QFS1_9CARY|nr:hypothetical protein Cgig2_007730 [Carnegiea gigantea]
MRPVNLVFLPEFPEFAICLLLNRKTVVSHTFLSNFCASLVHPDLCTMLHLILLYSLGTDSILMQLRMILQPELVLADVSQDYAHKNGELKHALSELPNHADCSLFYHSCAEFRFVRSMLSLTWFYEPFPSLTDEHAMRYAAWALETYNEKNKANLELVEIHEAQYCRNGFGTYYRFLISTTDRNRNGSTRSYKVEFRRAPLRHIHLLCFEPCQGCADEL